MQPHPPPWPICFGLETELGITVMEDPEADVVEESIALVRSAAQHGVANLWDYATEDPHRDARGFRAAELLQDTDEANYYSQDARRELTFQEIKSDLVLRNGARFYNDHAHPEYSTPECATLLDLIAQDKAGERLLEECARRGHAARLAHGQALQEQHRFPRPQLRLPRQLPHPARHSVGPPRAGDDAVPRHAPALRAARARSAGNARTTAARRAASRFRSAPISFPSWSASTR